MRTKGMIASLIVILTAISITAATTFLDPTAGPASGLTRPQHEQHEHSASGATAGTGSQDQHHADVNRRGDMAMGFSHLKTTHHFILKSDGGVIDVGANDPKDTESRDQIRMHLRHIASLFKSGDFSAPMLTHGKTPPGVPEMTRLKSDISYTFEETERGARVRISTGNAEALQAVHEFLRFQITDHETGDPLKVER